MKGINIKGIIILVALLAAIQLGVGMFISPMVGKIVINTINKTSAAKINIKSINVWPLTVSCSMKEIKIFDPDDESKLMVEVKKASAGLSPIALLSKRLVVSGVSLSDVMINLEGEPDGSFNVAKILEPKEGAPEKKGSMFDRFKGKKDLFTRVYNMVKDRNAEGSSEEAKKERKDAKKIETEVVELPRGRRVEFTTERESYLVEIRKLSVNDAKIHVTSDGGEVDVNRGDALITGLRVDPKKGANFDTLKLKGSLAKSGEPVGSFNLSYRSVYTSKGVDTDIDVTARGVDMSAIEFIYEGSLPVDVNKGILDLSSTTQIDNENLNSKNNLTLTDFELSGSGGMVGMIPMATLCEALNQVQPLKLNIGITGTLQNPKFSGLEQTLLEVTKPYLQNVEKQAVGAATGALEKKLGIGGASEGGSEASKEEGEAVDAIKSLFGGSK